MVLAVKVNVVRMRESLLILQPRMAGLICWVLEDFRQLRFPLSSVHEIFMCSVVPASDTFSRVFCEKDVLIKASSAFPYENQSACE